MKGTISTSWGAHISEHQVTGFGESIGTQEIAAWLTDDVRYVDEADRCVSIIKEMEEGKQSEPVVLSGNAHHATFSPAGLLLEHESIEEMRAWLTLPQAMATLVNFKQFLKSDRKNKEARIEPFVVEFEREGRAA